MATIYLIRHGQAEGNYYRRCHSWHNGLLTHKGREQVRLLEERFQGVHFDAVYSSDLYRAMSTAGAIYRPRGLTLRVDPDLREIGAGIWEDVPWGQLLHDHRDSLASFLRCEPDWQIEGSERFPQVRARIQRAMERIVDCHPDQTVAVVSHGCAIRAGLSAWLGMRTEQMGQLPLPDNTGVAKLTAQNGRIQVEYYNDNSHLGALAAPTRTGGDYALAGMEKNALRYLPLPLPQEAERYLTARAEHWQAVHSTANGFNGPDLLAEAQVQSGYNPNCVLTALHGETPVGLLQMDWQREANQGIGWVVFLYMMPEFRGKGLAVQLLGQAVSVYRTMGRRFLRVCCEKDDQAGMAFLRALGFVQTGRRGQSELFEKYIGLEL